MEIQNQPEKSFSQIPEIHKRHFRSFWPIVLIAVLSALVGGILVFLLFNQGLDEELNSLLPGSSYRQTHEQVKDQEINTSTWQTYTNEEYGFEFKYPKNLYTYFDKNKIFNVQSSQKQLVFGEPFGVKGTEGVDYVTDGYSFYLNIADKNQTDSFDKDNSVKTKLNNINFEAYWVEEDGVNSGPTVEIVDPKNPKNYIVMGYSASCNNKVCNDTEVEGMFNQILSTFKFTN